ncbi:MAG: hypothetical protein HYY92_00320 [Parcubacteria group bacterium]|nr:hypothetical protein [Parcubacteria group bacterium]
MNSRFQYILGASYYGFLKFLDLAPFLLPLLIMAGVLFVVPFYRETVAGLALALLRWAPLWLTATLAAALFRLWSYYTRMRFLASQKIVLLEIRIPKNVDKSPLAMEVVLSSLHQTQGESTLWDRVMLGKVRAHFSLEIISIEGNVKFLIYTRQSMRTFLESQIYSQYPSSEIHEVPDYITHIPYAKRDSNWSLFAVEFGLIKPDPYPIKTYVDYETNKDVFEEKKVDPITPLLEWMGSLGPGEQAWFQVLVRSNKGIKDPTTYWMKDWQGEAKKLINDIINESKKRLTISEEMPGSFPYLSEGERMAMKAIERSVGKLGFDCGIRAIYLAKKDAFNGASIGALFGTVKQYNSNDLNGFKPTKYTDFDYPWQDLYKYRLSVLKWKMFDAYRRRSWFLPPYERKPFVLNSEELATIYHFPGQVATTPTFERIESKKAEPPRNLPT